VAEANVQRKLAVFHATGARNLFQNFGENAEPAVGAAIAPGRLANTV